MTSPDVILDLSLADPLDAEPFSLLRRWIDEAIAKQVKPNPTAMTLATVDPDGRPSARMVLCRGVDYERGCFVFYGDMRSRKARALARIPRAALVFHWDPLQRQARIEGPVTLSPQEEADAYFESRPRDAQIGAWSSEQSAPIDSRGALEDAVAETAVRFGAGTEAARQVPRPPFWSGHRIWAERIELWVGRPGRIHDRGLWTRELEPEGDEYRGTAWRVTRLQP